MNIEQLIREMTVEEKAALIAGTDFMYTNPIPRLGIPSLCVSDGPHGLRKQIGGGDNGVSQSEPATAFPTASLTACGWNPDNLRRMGAAEAEGVQSQGVGVSVKHFAMNNSENYRFMGDSIASEKTVRALYLKPFEYIVKHARPATVMCAYPQSPEGQAALYADVIAWGKAHGVAGIRYWAPDFEGWYAMAMFDFQSKKGAAKEILRRHLDIIEGKYR